MFYRIILFLMFIFSPLLARADVASVGYIHNLIYSETNVNLSIEAGNSAEDLSSSKYFLEQIDRVNESLNGRVMSDYANSADATTMPITSAKVLNDIGSLIIELEAISVTITNVNAFSLEISASGNFTIDWADGTIDTITKTDTNSTTYSHNYSSSGTYTISIDGLATAYSSNAAIKFSNSTNKQNMTSVAGNFGKVFPAIGGYAPSFNSIFSNCSGLTTLPGGLFIGVDGTPVESMFNSAFANCTGLTTLPSNLFDGISGAPTNYMFTSAFSGCSSLTTLPSGLFAGINGAPAIMMFAYTFTSCNALNGNVPANFFGTFTGSPASQMFAFTFYWCSNLAGVENGIWDLTGISNTNVGGLFDGMFHGCLNITGLTPTLSATNSTNLWDYFTAYTPASWGKPFTYCNNMTDYANISSDWK